ncbi:MAG: hypothetical protein ACRDVG_08390 [Jatrophihabitantaceae bacterium]
MGTARSWLVGLTASGTMLVLIAVFDNQWVSTKVYRHVASGDSGPYARHILYSLVSYSWRVTRLGDNPDHLFVAQLIFDIAVLALVFLFVAALSRGHGSFVHIFLGTWIAVIAASVLAVYVKAAIVDTRAFGSGTDKGDFIFFANPFGGSELVTAAVIYGAVVALVAALVGAATRRSQVVPTAAPAAGAPATPQGAARQPRAPWSAPPAPEHRDGDDGVTSSEDDSDRTRQLPAVGSDSDPREDTPGEQTTQLPRAEDPGNGAPHSS